MPKSEANRIECAVYIYHNSIDLLLKAQANQIMHIHSRAPTYTIFISNSWCANSMFCFRYLGLVAALCELSHLQVFFLLILNLISW